MKSNTSVKIEILCQEFRNSRNKLEAKIIKSIKKALAEFEYESCPCVCLGDDRLHYIDVDDNHRVVNVIRLSPVEKQGVTLTKKEVVMLADPIAGDPDYRDTELLRLETCNFDPLDVLDCIGKVAEKMEIEKISSSL